MTKILGVALVVVGLLLALTTVMRFDRDDASGRITGTTQSEREAPGALSAVALPLVAGLSFASGIVLLVVGVGRWSHPRTRPEPGDAVVDPEAHHKMDHV